MIVNVVLYFIMIVRICCYIESQSDIFKAVKLMAMPFYSHYPGNGLLNNTKAFVLH